MTLWCLATTASIAVASLALRPVLRTAVPDDSVPLPATGALAPGRATVPMPSTGPVPSSVRSSGMPAGSASGSAPPSSTASGGASRSPRPPSPASAIPTTTVDGWTVTTEADGTHTYLRSFRSDGGDAVMRIRSGVVSLVTATPRDGFSVSKTQSEPNRLVVQFVGVNVAYLVDALWWQDGPYGQVSKVG